MDQITETFTLTDRRELIKQGLQLDQLVKDLSDVRTLVKDDITEVAKGAAVIEARVRVLEDFRLAVRSQMTTSIWFLGGVLSLANVLMNIFMKIYWK